MSLFLSGALRGVGTVVLFFALAVLSFNGYVEDFGDTPSRTWPEASALAAAGVLLFVGAHLFARAGPPGPPPVTGRGNVLWGFVLGLALAIALAVLLLRRI